MITYCTKCWTQNSSDATTCRNCGAALEPIAGDYTEKLLAALYHPEPGTVQMAAWVLGELRETKAVPALTELLRQSDEPGAIEAAVEALGKIGPTSAVSVLANSSRWPLRVRIKVAEALGSIGEVKTEKALLTLLQDPSSLVKSLAADALSRLLQ
jgi:HEAT repeat protein